ncbi:MAG: protein-glutamate O-methyltransferase CheR [bacterium]|jgi:chemotaxis protein methyltransferase CheR|nr:protein-glutamate O-methyltransferase CheR [bacterium]MBK9775086.1 protein-glutamate O-methyltransferase CheR [bacterium]
MATAITTREFDRIREFLQRETSISLTDDKAYLVETRLSEIMKAHGLSDYGALSMALQANLPRGLRDLVIDAMTTNETLWFRDVAPFDAFRDHLLPAWAGEIAAGKRQKVRIWSAACSTGQEPYSLSMLYHEASRRFPSLRPENLDILATDLSDSSLATARAGIYGGMAIQRGLPDSYLERYFTPGADGRHEVRREIRDRVVFRKFNLRDSFVMMGSFDIILTRYVLIYFQDDFKREVLRKVHGALDKSGVLFLGSSESLPENVPGYAMVRRGRATWYQKVEAGAGKAPLPAQARPATTPVATAPPAPASPQSRPPEAGPAPTGAAVDLNVVMQRLKDMNAKYDK